MRTMFIRTPASSLSAKGIAASSHADIPDRLSTLLRALARVATLAALVWAAAGPAHAAPTLEALHYAAGKRVEQVWPHRWGQGRALSVTLRATDTGNGEQRELRVLRPPAPGGSADSWAVLGAWPLTSRQRFAEPLRLQGGKTGWLFFEGNAWTVLAPAADGATLVQLATCTCPSTFSKARYPSRTDDRFAHDLTGDGADEVLLPAPDGLRAFRVDVAQGQLTPLWHSRWTADGTALQPDPKRPDRYVGAPRVVTRPVKGGGTAVLMLGDAAVWSLLAPAGGAPAATPLTPQHSALEGLPAPGKTTVLAVHAAEDMDGDGLPDLLHLATLNADNVLNQKNEMRWYPGRLENGALRFGAARRTLKSDGGSFADVLRLSAQGQPPHLLVVAQGEVTMGSVLQLLATGQASFQMGLYAWTPGALSEAPLDAGTLTFRGLSNKGARPAILAITLDGSGQRSVLVNTNADELSAFAWRPEQPGQPLFGTPPFAQAKVSLPVTDDTRFVADADGDGREELVFWHRKGKAAQRETLTLVRLRPE